MIRIIFESTVPDEEIINVLPDFEEQKIRYRYSGRLFRRGRVRVSFHHSNGSTKAIVATDSINLHERIIELLKLAKSMCQFRVASIDLSGRHFSEDQINYVGGFGDVPIKGARKNH